LLKNRLLSLFAIGLFTVLGISLHFCPRVRVYGQVAERSDEAVNYSGPLKIVKLLWNANPKSAASTLRRSILTAVERNSVEELRDGMAKVLGPQIAQAFSELDAADPRYAVAVAATVLAKDSIPTEDIKDAFQSLDSLEDRELVWRVWLSADPLGAQG
jgi:hypothetical protein